MKHPLKLGLLFGGESHERETSLDSGRNVLYKLSSVYPIIPLFVDQSFQLYHVDPKLLVCNSTQEIAEHVQETQRVAWADLPELVDFVFIALHGGKGENGALQGALELLGLPYNGSGVLTSALCMNKHKTNAFLSGHGFAVPHSYLLSKQTWLTTNPAEVVSTITTRLPFPLIIKPHDDGCSVYVFKATTAQELQAVLDRFFSTDKQYALIEECITGMELTAGVLGNQAAYALPPSYCVATRGILSIEEKFLPGAGENQTPAPLSAQAQAYVQKTMEQAYRTLGCQGYARIDCFYQAPDISPTGKDHVVILEVNTLPALTPATCLFHQAAELHIKPVELLESIIQLGLEQHRHVPRTWEFPEVPVAHLGT